VYAQFPSVHFGMLYSLSVLPAVALNYVIDPLYSNVILNGDDIADAEFVPVSIGFAVVSACSIFFPIYHHFWLGKGIRVDNSIDVKLDEEEKSDEQTAL